MNQLDDKDLAPESFSFRNIIGQFKLAASTLLGRGSANGRGEPEEITLGGGLTMTGRVLDVSGAVGLGTVTSVGLAVAKDATVNVSGSPVTTTGTLTLTAVDAGSDKIEGWDDSADSKIYFTLGTGLSTSTTTLNVAIAKADDDTISVSGVTITAVDAGSDKLKFWDDSAGKVVYATLAGGLEFSGTVLQAQNPGQYLLADQDTAITTGLKLTVRWFACTLLEVRTFLNTVSSSGSVTVDVQDDGVSVFSTKPSIDASEKTNLTGTVAVISNPTIADDSEMTFIIDAAGTGAKGLGLSFRYRLT